MMAMIRFVAAVAGSAVALALGTVPAAAAAGTQVTVPVAADTYTYLSAPTTDYGLSASLGVYGTPDITSVLRFIIPAAPSGQALVSATLQVRTTTLSSAGSQNALAIREATDSWAETGTFYANRPVISGPSLGALPGGTVPDASYSVPLDAAVLGAWTGSHTLAVVGSGSDSTWMYSKQAPLVAQRPVLILSYADGVPPDTVPPSVPSGLAAVVTGSSISLSWLASTDSVGVVGYAVHRSASPGFVPDPASFLANTNSLAYTDPAVPAGTWYYRITAFDAAGNVSAGSPPVSVTVGGSAPPTVVTVADSADTYTSSSAPTTENGTSSSLAVFGSPDIASALRFSIPAPPAGQVLSSASLHIQSTTLATAGSATAVSIRAGSDSWTEIGTRYANRPLPTGAVLGTLPGGSAANTPFDVALDPAGLGNTAGSRTLVLTGSSGDSFFFWSREAAASRRPVLTLTFSGGVVPPDPQTVTVMAAGDIACAPGSPITPSSCRQGDVGAIVTAASPARFIALGDLQYQNATISEFMGSGGYNDSFGALKPITLPVVGNHELLDGNNGYFEYFYGPGVSSGSLGARPDGYYSQMIGSWKFIGLDSECDPGGVTGGCGVGSPQYTWLQAQLTNSPVQCTIVAAHRPRWSTGASHGSYAGIAALWDLMAANGVDVMLAGHNHAAEIFKPIGVSGAGAVPTLSASGIRAFTVGTGGADLQNLSPSTDPLVSALDARSRTAFGPLKLVLGDNSYSWEYRPVPGMTFVNNGTSGSFSGTGTCH